MAAACCRSTEEYAKKTFPGVQMGPGTPVGATFCAISSAAAATTAERLAGFTAATFAGTTAATTAASCCSCCCYL